LKCQINSLRVITATCHEVVAKHDYVIINLIHWTCEKLNFVLNFKFKNSADLWIKFKILKFSYNNHNNVILIDDFINSYLKYELVEISKT